MTLAGAPRYQLGPLAMAIEADALRAFVDDAPVGERITYAEGAVAPQKAEAFRLAGELARAGKLRLHNPRRPSGGFEWIAVKLAPVAAEEPAALAPTPMGDEIDQRVLRALMLTAKAGRMCPTNAELAQTCGLPDPDAASYRVRKLVAKGAISVIDNGPSWRRIITIAATGQSTVEGRL